MKDNNNDNDADSVTTASSNPNASNRSDLKRRRVFMAILLFYNHQFILEFLMMSRAVSVILSLEIKKIHVKGSVTVTRIIEL
jgi:hypothetical protein